jgi:hypothetical protein
MRLFPIGTLSVAIAMIALGPAQSATPDTDIKRPAVFCRGEYALCIRALCTRDPSSNDTVKCACVVENGWSMGPDNCQDRAAAAKNGTPISTYSNRFNTEDKTLTCADPQTQWAWCYGAPCTVDPNNPKAAICTCPVKTSPMRTLGGQCDHSSCSQIWSAATPEDDRFANNHFYNYMTKHHPNYPANEPAIACFGKRI